MSGLEIKVIDNVVRVAEGMGPAGPQGIAGATGPVGPAGAAGAAGATGSTGVAGSAGPTGPTGVPGPMGPAGPTGNNGNDGATGPVGPAGPAGPTGAGGSPDGSGTELQRRNGTALGAVTGSAVDVDGRVGLGGTPSARLHVFAAAASEPAFIAQMAVSATDDGWQLKDAAGNVVLRVTCLGALQTGGGNARGPGAVDLTVSRSDPSQVASGTGAFQAGANSKASGPNAVAIGYQATASGQSALALGQQSTASGAQSIAAGNGANASFAGAIAIGENASASGWHSVGLGYSPQSSGAFGLATGYAPSTRGVQGARAHCSNWGGGFGARQWMDLHVQCNTVDATPTLMTSDAAGASASNVLPLLNNSTVVFTVIFVWRTAAGESGSAEICCTAKRGASASATSIVGATTPRIFGCDAAVDPALTTVAPSVVADTTRGGIVPQFVGLAGTSMKADAYIVIVHTS